MLSLEFSLVSGFPWYEFEGSKVSRFPKRYEFDGPRFPLVSGFPYEFEGPKGLRFPKRY